MYVCSYIISGHSFVHVLCTALYIIISIFFNPEQEDGVKEERKGIGRGT